MILIEEPFKATMKFDFEKLTERTWAAATAFEQQSRLYLDEQVSKAQLNHSHAITLWHGESINAQIEFLLPRFQRNERC